MRCLLCHSQLVVFVNLRKHLRKCLVTYHKTSGIICLQKHLDADHSTIYKRFWKVNNQGKEKIDRQFVKKRSFISNSSIFYFFISKDLFKNDDVEQKMFVENLALLIVKNHLPLQFVDKCVVKMFSVTIMYLCAISFSKIIFKHCFAWIGGEK
jgi:hypothetical protein